MGFFTSFAASTSDCQRAAQTLKQYLEDVGIFDSVSLNSSYEVLCTYTNETVARFQFEASPTSGVRGTFHVSFGTYTNGAFGIYQTGDCIWIGKTANGVSIGTIYGNGGDIHTQCVLCKSRSGVPMMCLHSEASPYFIALTADCEATAATGTETAPTTNAYYSNLCGICTRYAGGETSAAASNVYRFVERQTSVSVQSMSQIDISGTTFITDGFFALLDS